MKKHIRFVMLFCSTLWMLCLLSGCAGQEGYGPSSVSLDAKDEEWMAVSIKETGKTGVTFVLKNCGHTDISYGDRNILEKNMDGQWREVLSYTRREMTEPDYLLEPGVSTEYETTWDSLSEGDYRYILPFRVMDGETGNIHYAAVNFTV